MASHPDANPDSVPSGPSDSPEQVSPSDTPGRESVEDISGEGTDQQDDADTAS